MGLEQYDQYTANGMTIGLSSIDDYVRFLQINSFGGNAAGALVRTSTSGLLHGGLGCTILDTGGNAYITGVSFLHSTRNITASAGQFYTLGLAGANMRLWKYQAGAANNGNVTLLQEFPVTSSIQLGFSVYWDANFAGLGGTRITAFDASNTLLFDMLDPFSVPSYSSGEGAFVNDRGGGLLSVTTPLLTLTGLAVL